MLVWDKQCKLKWIDLRLANRPTLRQMTNLSNKSYLIVVLITNFLTIKQISLKYSLHQSVHTPDNL